MSLLLFFVKKSLDPFGVRFSHHGNRSHIRTLVIPSGPFHIEVDSQMSYKGARERQGKGRREGNTEGGKERERQKRKEKVVIRRGKLVMRVKSLPFQL